MSDPEDSLDKSPQVLLVCVFDPSGKSSVISPGPGESFKKTETKKALYTSKGRFCLAIADMNNQTKLTHKDLSKSSWWLNQPNLKKTCYGSFPQKIGVKMKNIWNHHLDIVYKAKYTIHQDTETHGFRRPKPLNEKYLKPPPSCDIRHGVILTPTLPCQNSSMVIIGWRSE